MTGRSAEFVGGSTNHHSSDPVLEGSYDNGGSHEVTLSNVQDTHSDHLLSTAAGLTERHFGSDVTRYPDEGKARVRLWKT